MKIHSLKILLIHLILISTPTFVNGQDSSRELSSKNVEKTIDPQTDQTPQNVINTLIVPISKILVLVSTSIGIFIAIRQYRLKVKEEIRLSRSAQSENDIKLLTLFAETIDIANCRKTHIISEKIIENLFLHKIITLDDFKDEESLKILNNKLSMATRVIPVGQASQHSAIAAIGILGEKYEILREPAIKGLESLDQQGIKYPTANVLASIKKEKLKESWWFKVKNWW